MTNETPSPAIPDGERLLPCPNGHIDKAICSTREDGMYGVTTHEVCCCDCHWRIVDQATKADAIAAWNTRPSPARESVRVTDALAAALLAAEQFLHVGVDRGPAINGWENTRELVTSALSEYAALRVEPAAQPAYRAVPIPMLLWCPDCCLAHIDEGEWATRPHKTHRCEHCSHEWRPANVPTVGVYELGLVVPVGEPERNQK